MQRLATMIAAVATCATLAGCSRSSGIPQVDRARDEIASALGIGPAFAPIGDAADVAARNAEAAGRHGDARGIARAVGGGTARVVCAGMSLRGRAAAQTASTVDRLAPDIEHKAEALATYRAYAARIPDMPNPCT
jgi:hypothetical protein